VASDPIAIAKMKLPGAAEGLATCDGTAADAFPDPAATHPSLPMKGRCTAVPGASSMAAAVPLAVGACSPRGRGAAWFFPSAPSHCRRAGT
jgi:hypothetical protein